MPADKPRRVHWKRPPNPDSLREKHKLTPDEQAGVRRALGALRIRLGNWRRVARALRTDRTTITRVICIRKSASAGFAVRVAKLAGVPTSEVLAGAFPRPGQCPFCGSCVPGAPQAEWDDRMMRATEPEFSKARPVR
jgi:hypothetical protein